MDTLGKIIETLRGFFQKHGKEIIKNSPMLRRVCGLYRLVKRKITEFLIKRFLSALVTAAVLTACLFIFFPHIFFSDRCYLMSITNVTLTTTTASRPCVHGTLLAFMTTGNSVYFSAELFSEDPAPGRWYQNDFTPSNNYTDYIEFRHDVEDKEYLIDSTRTNVEW